MRVRVTLGEFDYICNTEHEVAAMLTGVTAATGRSQRETEGIVDQIMTRLHAAAYAHYATISTGLSIPSSGEVVLRRLEDRREG